MNGSIDNDLTVDASGVLFGATAYPGTAFAINSTNGACDTKQVPVPVSLSPIADLSPHCTALRCMHQVILYGKSL